MANKIQGLSPCTRDCHTCPIPGHYLVRFYPHIRWIRCCIGVGTPSQLPMLVQMP
jgi:hypothetical protein